METTGTACLSSQIGCSLNCSFCHTGTQKFLGNLDYSDIIAQVLLVKKEIGDFSNPKRALTNIVFMGQGEPLYNFKNVKKAISFLQHQMGYAPWRSTISTSGVVPLIPSISKEIGASIAISLHAVNDTLRDQLVPLNKQFPIKELMSSCKEYLKYSGTQNSRITFEYVMLRSVNDSLADAKQLIRLLNGFPAHVNLIPFNQWPGTSFECSTTTAIENFQNMLKSYFPTHVRMARGQDILAACGQLKSSMESKSFR